MGRLLTEVDVFNLCEPLDLALEILLHGDSKGKGLSFEVLHRSVHRLVVGGRGFYLYNLVKDKLLLKLKRVKEKTSGAPVLFVFDFILGEYNSFSRSSFVIADITMYMNRSFIPRLKLAPFLPIQMFKEIVLRDRHVQNRISDSLISMYYANKRGESLHETVRTFVEIFGDLDRMKFFYLIFRGLLLPQFLIRVSCCIMFESD